MATEQTLREVFLDMVGSDGHTHRIDTARRCAALTIPALFPEDGHAESEDLPLTYDSTAARGLSGLASKITDAVFPPNGVTLFSITPDKSKVPPGTDTTAEQNQLNHLCRMVADRLYNTNLRSCFTDSNEMMLAGGDDLIWFHDDWSFSSHSLEDFAISRLPNKKVVEVLLREWLDPYNLPDDWDRYPKTKDDEDCCCYTHCTWDNEVKVWKVRKEFRDVVVSEGEYKYQPFVVNSWRSIPREHYSRSFVEENEGDIRMTEVLGKSLKECSVIASKLLMGVDPSGISEIQDFQSTENGQFIAARNGEVFPIQATAPAQMQTIQSALQLYRRDVGKTFLDVSSIQRNGDRVTATEWAAMTRQLISALGPNFSAKSDDVQGPIIRRAIALMVDSGEIPSEILKQIQPGNLLTLRIRTGLTILQQDIEEAELAEFMQTMANNPLFAAEINARGLLNRYVAAKRWDPTGLIKTPEEKQAEMQAAMQMQAAQQGIQSIGRIAEAGASAPR